MKQREKDVIERIRRALSERVDDASLERARADARSATPARSLSEALSADRLALIVEPKRATATRGVINPNLDVAAVARECGEGGATALSIVTEGVLSRGSLDDLRLARQACDLPLLARDFVVHETQVCELRAAGADALFIPVVAFIDGDLDPQETLEHLVDAALHLNMEVVLSVRTSEELAFALDTEAEIINIDNRDDDGHIGVERTFELLAEVPVGKTVISESVADVTEVARLHRAGVDALLLDEGHVDTDLSHALKVFADMTLDEEFDA